MMKEIQKLKKQLLMEELKRQGKAPKKRLWVFFVLIMLVLFSAAGYWYRANLQTRLEESFQEGLVLRDSGRYDAAADLFLRLHREHPAFQKAPQALFQAAEIQDLYLGQYSEALLNYLLLERDYPEAAEVEPAIRQVAVLYKYRLNDCSQAIAIYQRVLDQPGHDSDQLQYEVADCYFRLNNFEQARIEFESLLKNYPESELIEEVQYRIAMTYALESMLPEAVAAYRLVLERWPDSPYALEASFGLATVLEEQEKLLEALDILEGLAGIYPKQDILERKTAQVRERIEKKKKAI
jgi:TolA-binding protein